MRPRLYRPRATAFAPPYRNTSSPNGHGGYRLAALGGDVFGWAPADGPVAHPSPDPAETAGDPARLPDRA